MWQAGDEGKQQAHVYGDAAAAGISEAGSQAHTMAGQAGDAGQDLAKQAKQEGAQIEPAADRIATEVIEPGTEQVSNPDTSLPYVLCACRQPFQAEAYRNRLF